jgi:hypothetical protein
MGASGNTAGYLSAASSLAQSANSIQSSISQAQAIRMQGREQERISKLNERIANLRARDATSRGEEEVRNAKTRAKQFIGSQRAHLAAQGIDVGVGSAIDVQVDTELKSEQEVQTIRNNAWREAWGYKIEAVNASAQGAYASMAAKNQARNTLITGGYQAAAYGLQGFSSIPWKSK